MKPSRLETLLYAFGTLLVLAGAATQIGHLLPAGQGYAVLLAGIALGSAAGVLANRRMRALQKQNQELQAQLAERTQQRQEAV